MSAQSRTEKGEDLLTMSDSSVCDIINGRLVNGGLGMYTSADIAKRIARQIEFNTSNGVSSKVDMSDIDTASKEFFVELMSSVYGVDCDFDWVKNNVAFDFGNTEIGQYYRRIYNNYVHMAREKYDKAHGIKKPEKVESVTLFISDMLKMDNLVYSWQARHVYEKALELLRSGKAVKFHFGRKGRMNLDFLHALFVGFFTGKDISQDEVRHRLFMVWNRSSKDYDRRLFREFEEMMAAYVERLNKIAKIKEQNAKKLALIDRVFNGGHESPTEERMEEQPKPSYERMADERDSRRSKKDFNKRRKDLADDYDDWKNWK